MSLKKSAKSRKIADAEVEEDVAAAVATIGNIAKLMKADIDFEGAMKRMRGD